MALKFESFDGGRDSKERLLQGLLVAATKTPEKSLIVVFTDNGTKDLKLKDEILVSVVHNNILQMYSYVPKHIIGN
jgi:hypothetical protein